MKKLYRRFKQLLLIIWLFIVVAFGAWFTHENSQVVNIKLVGFSLPDFPLALYLAIAISFGAFFGWLVTYLSLQKKISEKKRDLRKVKKEVTQLRSTYASDAQ